MIRKSQRSFFSIVSYNISVGRYYIGSLIRSYSFRAIRGAPYCPPSRWETESKHTRIVRTIESWQSSVIDDPRQRHCGVLIGYRASTGEHTHTHTHMDIHTTWIHTHRPHLSVLFARLAHRILAINRTR